MKHQSYFTRALKARDPRYARIFDKLGYSTADLTEVDPEIALTDLRDAYEKLFGKKPFHGWSAETLSEKIAQKREEG